MELQTGGFAGDIARSQQALNTFENSALSAGKATTGWADTAQASFANIGSGLAALATKLAVTGLAGAAIGGIFVKSAADLQQTSKSFEVLTGSVEVANKLFAQLATYANNTPFEFPDIAKAGQTLLGFGIKSDQVFDKIKILGDVAAATGADFGSLALVFGQVNATGKLMGQDALQLINNKIPIFNILGKKMGITAGEVKAQMEKGAIGVDLFNQALLETTQKGGFAFQGVDVLAKSFNGRMSTLKDTVLEFGRNLLGVKVDKELGLTIKPGGVFDLLSQSIPKITASLSNLAPVLISAFEFIIKNGNTIVAVIVAFGAALVAAKVASWALSLAGLAVQFLVTTGAITGATAAQWGFNAAAAANPIGLIVAAVIALIAVLAFLQVKFDIFGKTFRVLKTAIEPFVNIIKLLATGDFQGGIFGLQEDSPIIGVFLQIHKVMKQVYDFTVGQLKSAFTSLAKIGSQVAETMKPVVDALKGILANKTVQTVLKGIGIALAVIVAAPVVSFFAGIAVAIGAVVATITVLSKVLGFIADHFDTIKKVIAVTLAVAFLPLTIAIGAIILVVKNFSNIMTVVGTVITAVGNAVKTVFSAISSVVTTVFGAIFAVYNATLRPVLEGIGFIVKALFTIWVTIWTGIAQVLFTVVSTIVQIIGVVLYGSFKWLMDNVLTPVGKFFAQIWNGIVAVVSSTASAIWSVITTTFTTIWNFITMVWNAIYGTVSGVVSSLFNTVSSVFNAIWSRISGIVGGIWNTVSGTFNNIKNTVVNAVTDAVNGVTNLGGRFLEAGKNIINGLVNGISNGKDMVVNKIKDICSGALDSVKKFFGIKSPSRVMAQMGTYVMQGFGKGVESQADAMAKTMYQASSNVADNFKPTIAGQIDYSRIGGAGFGQTPAGNNSNVQMYGNINIASDADGDRFLTNAGLMREGQLVERGMATP